MPPRSLRCPEPLWERVELEAAADGIGTSEVVRRALRYYFERGCPAGA
jgi:hypothetical protein